MVRSRGFVAVDLGASSGRVGLVRFDGERIRLDEAHRFANRPVLAHDTLYWDALGLWGEVCAGIRRCAEIAVCDLASVGVDTWGVDYALLDRRGRLLGNPVCYRDDRTAGVMELVTATVPRAEIFAATGTQFIRGNTLYQLVAALRDDPRCLDSADRLLMMPDLFHDWLTGSRAGEFTAATTTQFLNAATRQWATGLLDRLGIPSRILGDLVDPATSAGRIRRPVRDAESLPDLDVVLPASHDTASAVAAASLGPGSAYVSCGTWSLIGVEFAAPKIDSVTLDANFTNEGGLCGTWRYLRNSAGLWLIEECRRSWTESGQPMSHADVSAAASAAPGLRSLIDVDDPALFTPDDMPAAIQRQCADRGRPVPSTPGEVARCVLDSLALRYRRTIRAAERLSGRSISEVRLFGGGSRNRLLCQLTADATGVPVVAGPAEASALGNALGQMIARGDVADLTEGRSLIDRSIPSKCYEPSGSDGGRRRWGACDRAMLVGGIGSVTLTGASSSVSCSGPGCAETVILSGSEGSPRPSHGATGDASLRSA